MVTVSRGGPISSRARDGGEVTRRPLAVPDATAVLRTWPSAASAAVMTWLPSHVVRSPGSPAGASEAAAQVMPVTLSFGCRR